ncbi:MAG: hypothetical protein JWQ35_2401 [Bacteriovoracaceae bacterium]|nr:hypothetical protein [Bacteriovoracaceae bacterium]
MEIVLAVLQLIFILFIFSIALLFLFVLLLTWSWAQTTDQETVSLREILSTTAIEWGALITLTMGQIIGVKGFWEAPPILSEKVSARQLPVIFIPSLHTSSGLFRILLWRLQKHFFTSLWPFSWKSFLNSNDLLEDQLLQFIHDVLKSTKSPTIRLVSFGTSRPIISRVLSHPSLSEIQKHWIAISAPKKLSRTLQFLSTTRTKNCFQISTRSFTEPNLLIRGSRDVICYPDDVWGEGRSVSISPIGHYAVMLHPITVQRALEELS